MAECILSQQSNVKVEEIARRNVTLSLLEEQERYLRVLLFKIWGVLPFQRSVPWKRLTRAV